MTTQTNTTTGQYQQQRGLQRQARIIFYDGDCAICRLGKNLAQHFVNPQQWSVAPIQHVRDHKRLLGCQPEQAMDSMHVLDRGQHFHAYPAVVHVLCSGRQASPLYRLLLRPCMRRIGDLIYGWIARSRPCADGKCALR